MGAETRAVPNRAEVDGEEGLWYMGVATDTAPKGAKVDGEGGLRPTGAATDTVPNANQPPATSNTHGVCGEEATMSFV